MSNTLQGKSLPAENTKGSDAFRKEKSLLNWLNEISMAKLFDWVEAVQETTASTNMGNARWRTETDERDRLFLTRLGVLKAQYLVTIVKISGYKITNRKERLLWEIRK